VGMRTARSGTADDAVLRRVVRGTVRVRGGKGDKDRMSVLPRSIVGLVAEQAEYARRIQDPKNSRQDAGNSTLEACAPRMKKELCY
ncbi:MAG: hypothetical protein HC845_07485, partial [Akkermansiaceae bacterium]|nr:hypothetical protein [Akkermansiaceae bacterium]